MTKEPGATVDVVPGIPTGNGNYKESIRKQLNKVVGEALDREARELTVLLTEEREKAISQLVEENRSVIKDVVEEGKKIIWAKAQVPFTADSLGPEYLDEIMASVHEAIAVDRHEESEETLTAAPAREIAEWTEVEILPPRDQDEIEAINDYLNRLPEIVSVELITLVDKSIFRIRTGESVDFVEVLSTLPQVLETKIGRAHV